MYDNSVYIANVWWEHVQEDGIKGKDQPIYFPEPIDLNEISILQRETLETMLAFYQKKLREIVPDSPITGDKELDQIVLLHRALVKDSLNYPLTQVLLLKLKSYREAKEKEEYKKYGCFILAYTP